MSEKEGFLKDKIDADNFEKILKIKNKKVKEFIYEFIKLCQPKEVFVSNGSLDDIKYIRDKAIEDKEEIRLKIENWTVHFDSIADQGRATQDTKFLVPKNKEFDPNLNSIEREEGLNEIKKLLNGIMNNKRMYILFYTLGPANSEFSIPCIQITDSAYVAHSENLLYRNGYKVFTELPEDSDRFFKFVHSFGELENFVSKNIDKRRIYIDLEDKIVYSVNTQYGGNSIGLKKLAMRLSIDLGYKEGWLTEHMFIMALLGKNNRKTYFTGAFPSLCGKTSTATIESAKIVGDDIAFIREKNGKAFAVNVEKGVFGIIDGINKNDDKIIGEILEKPIEIIFSNILITEDNRR
jgi:phosphoenolpyruvate carboxykinase (GTP)